MSGWLLPLLAVFAALLAWRVLVIVRRHHRTDYGSAWLNWLEGLNRLFCLRFHRLEHDPLVLPGSGPAIVVAPHRSWLDPAVVALDDSDCRESLMHALQAWRRGARGRG